MNDTSVKEIILRSWNLTTTTFAQAVVTQLIEKTKACVAFSLRKKATTIEKPSVIKLIWRKQ